MSLRLKAKELKNGNRIKLPVDGTLVKTFLFFPVENPMQNSANGKITCKIQKRMVDLDPDEVFEVDPRHLYADQLQEMTGIRKIEFVQQDRPKGTRTVVRKYIGQAGQESPVILERDTQRKIFKIVTWPSWMPTMNPELRRDLELSKHWRGIEGVMRGYTGASIVGAPAPVQKKRKRKNPLNEQAIGDEIVISDADAEELYAEQHPANQ